MAKEFLFYGKNLQELKEMPLPEFAKMLKGRSKRSLLRRGEEVHKFLQRINKKTKSGKKIRTHVRSMIITPQMVGLTIEIHSGKEFIPIKIKEEMMGHFLGEFVLTRKRVSHGTAGVGATRSSAAAGSKPK